MDMLMYPKSVRLIPTRLQQSWCPGCFSFCKVVAKVHCFGMWEAVYKVTIDGDVAERETTQRHQKRWAFLPSSRLTHPFTPRCYKRIFIVFCTRVLKATILYFWVVLLALLKIHTQHPLVVARVLTMGLLSVRYCAKYHHPPPNGPLPYTLSILSTFCITHFQSHNPIILLWLSIAIYLRTLSFISPKLLTVSWCALLTQ